MNTVTKTIRAFFSDKDGKIVIWQTPNAPLLAWIVFTLSSHLFKHGSVHQITHIAATIALLIWALLEIKSGTSPFRRMLGLSVLIFSIVQWLR